MKKKHKNNIKKKILLAILLSGIISTFANASIPTKNKEIFNFDSLDNIPVVIEDDSVLSPYQIQGNFETGWNPANFWNPNDNGGVAIGPFQIHSKYMLASFFNYLEENGKTYFDMLNEKGGIRAIRRRNPEMKNFFCELCNDSAFIKLQQNFIDKANFQPRLSVLKSQYGLDISKRSPSIEGLLRVMSANIGWRTNDVVCEMVKYLDRQEYGLDINSISDTEFVKVMEQSVYKIIKKDIQPKFRLHLLNAYNKVINDDVIPNMEREKQANLMAERVKKSTRLLRLSNHHTNKINGQADENNFTLKINSKSKVVASNTNDKYFVRKKEFADDKYMPLSASNKSGIPPEPTNKADMIKEEKIVEKVAKVNDAERRPSLLRKAEAYLEAQKMLDAKNTQVAKIEKATAKVLTVEDVVAKASRRRRKSENDFSNILGKAIEFTI